MPEKNYTIRTATRPEIDMAVEWAAKEGWNPGLNDADCYYSADPEGFFIGLLGNEPVATISAIAYGNTFGFIGFYIVKPEYRRRGYGVQIWNAAVKHLKSRNIGLDGVVDQQDNYRKSGFKLAYRNIRYQGTGGGQPPENNEIIHVSDLPKEAVESYDRAFFPEARTRFLQSWIRQPDSVALGVMADQKLAGYGVIRKCRIGHKIGPLYADTPELAESLFLTLKSTASPNDPVFLDTPEKNLAAVSLAKQHHFEVVFETARMYAGKIPDLPLHRIFGVTSFEIG